MIRLKDDPQYSVKLPVFIDATCSGLQHFAAMMKDLDLAENVNLKPQMPMDRVKDLYTDLLEIINEEISNVGYSTGSLYPFLKYVELTRDIVKHPIMTILYNVSIFGIREQITGKLTEVKFVIDKKDSDENQKKELRKKKRNLIKKIYILPKKDEMLQDKITVFLDDKDVLKIAQIIYAAFFNRYPSIKRVYNYFKDIAKVMNKLNLPII